MGILPLTFHDLDFRHRFAPCRSRDGTASEKWVPSGMPRFRPAVTMTTFYLYRTNERTGELEGPCGTGICVTVPSNVPGKPHAYGVTAHHVIAGGAASIRFNRLYQTQIGNAVRRTVGTKIIEIEPHEWQFIPGGDDLAAIDITGHVGHEEDLLRSVPESDIADLDFIERVSLTLGEDVFMVGLFTGNPGKQFNHVAARFGNLSQLSNVAHPIKQGNGIVRPSHVIDMHSRPGFSGSPVFVYRTPGNDLTAIDRDGNFHVDYNAKNNAFVKLLGIHSGQFKERMDAEKAEGIGTREPIMDGDKLSVQSSMTIVIPAWSIRDLLNLPYFAELRSARERKARANGEPKIQPEASEVVSPTDNPSHKEDFMSLLNAAAKGNKPAS